MVECTPAPVTVVIPCYRCTMTISRAVASVFAQTWRPREVLLVDDHSGDGTLEFLHRITAQYPDNWIKVIALDKNRGPGTARNAGWENALEPYVALLDADDAWHPEKIDVQINWMIEHPGVALTGIISRVVRDENTEYGLEKSLSRDTIVFKKVSCSMLLFSNRFSTSGIVLKRDIPQRFQYGKRYSEDFLLWCRICLDGGDCYRCSLPMTYKFKAKYGAGGLSGNLWKMEIGQLESYLSLYQKGYFGRIKLMLLQSYSLLRYFKRVLFVGIKHIAGLLRS